MASAAKPAINHQRTTELAQEILKAMLRRYSDDKGFLDEKHSKEGLIFRCAGSISILLLVNAFKELQAEVGWIEIVTREFQMVVAHVKEKGYDATPLLEEGFTRDIFSPAAKPQRAYLDSVSWVLSFAIQMWYALWTGRLGHTKGSPEYKKHQSTIAETVSSTLQIICKACCPQGGWGFATQCTEPNLYYSYAVSEGLADFSITRSNRPLRDWKVWPLKTSFRPLLR